MQRYTEGPWDNRTPTTALAIEMRKRLGKHNDSAKPVVDLVEGVVETYDDLLAACEEALNAATVKLDTYAASAAKQKEVVASLTAAIAKANGGD